MEEEVGEDEGVEKKRQGDGEDEQENPSAASQNYNFHNVIPAWPCAQPPKHSKSHIKVGH